MAYRELRLNVEERLLVIGKTLRLNHKFRVVSGKVREEESIRSFLDEPELPLLQDFEANAEQIKDCIAQRCGRTVQVDDEPHVYVIERFDPSYLQGQYDAIVQMHREDELTYPLKAFFGNLVRQPRRSKEWPLSLYRDNANLDQLRTPEELDRLARELTQGSHEDLMRFLMVASLYRIKRLGEPRYAELLDIIMSEDDDEQSRSSRTVDAETDADAGEKPSRIKRFVNYLSDTQNMKMLLRVFPIVATTCMSAYRLGEPVPLFNMTIIDEASQCDTATALVPIIRGENLMLVGDPQQLNPVITVDRLDSEILRQSYGIGKEYDYVQNSLYKTFLACDAVSSEILLHAHYRCDERIIGFNNKKYYGGHLQILSGRRLPEALEFMSVEHDPATVKNTAPAEADAIARYARAHPDLDIGVITPFANQRAVISDVLVQAHVANASCGTVHSYQGDEKDVILFSLALTDRTADGTYRWLCNNRELINVATSRARDKLVLVGNDEQVKRLHAAAQETDDIFELVQYVKSKGVSIVTPRKVSSRALGVKPYSTKTEQAFLESLSHALDTIFMAGSRHVVQREVPIAQVLEEKTACESLFYSGRFDFVVYEVQAGRSQVPVLAIELDGKEHVSDAAVMRRDRTKEQICRRHGFQLIRVENSYARRYHYIKQILMEYFSG